MSKYKIIGIIGETCSGKSTIYNTIINNKELCKKYNIRSIKNLTTRPLRNELENNEYKSISKEDLKLMLKQNKLFNYMSFDTVYGKWEYASSKADINLNKHNYIIILDPERAYQSIQYFGNDIIIVKIDRQLEGRLLNGLKRKDGLSVEERKRRMLEEEKIFTEYSSKINWKTCNMDKISSKSMSYLPYIENKILKYLI